MFEIKFSVSDRVELICSGHQEPVFSQSEGGSLPVRLELILDAEDDASCDEVDDDDVVDADRLDAHDETAVVQMSSANDLSVRNVQRAHQGSVIEADQVDLKLN